MKFAIRSGRAVAALSLAGTCLAQARDLQGPPSGEAASKTTTVLGSAVVPGPSGGTVPLPSVHVAIMLEDEYARYVATFKAQLTESIKDHADAATAAAAQMTAAREAFEASAGEYQAAAAPFTAIYQNVQGSASINDEARQIVFNADVDGADAARMLESFNTALGDLAQKGLQLKDALDKLSSATEAVKNERDLILQLLARERDVVFDNLTPSRYIARAGTDGHFKITLSRPVDILLLARGSRDVGDSTETYFWILPLKGTDRDDSLEVDLTANNTVATVPQLELSDMVPAAPPEVPDAGQATIVTDPTPYQAPSQN